MRRFAPSLQYAAAGVVGLAFWGMTGCATFSRQTQPSTGGAAGGTEPAPNAIRMPDPANTLQVPLPDTDTSDMIPYVVAYRDYRDPLSPFNRVMFTFNDVTYRYVLIPVSKGYLWLMPDPAERSIGNFFLNLREPLFAVNHLLQFKPGRMSRSSLRFVVNSTIGVLGLFDPADAWLGLAREETGFADTLARYGLGYGIYLVLPIFGPSDLRDIVGRTGSYFVSPIPYLSDEPVTTGVRGFDTLQAFAPTAEDYRTLRRRSEDPYLFFRNLYLQGVQRDADYNP